MKSFEELVVFQRARELRHFVFELSSRFPDNERFGMTSQIRRAALSVMRHIAEGQGRLSYGEWRQFLGQARGSLYEVQCDAISALDESYLNQDQYESLMGRIRGVAAPLNGLIRYVVRCEKAKKTRSVTTRRPDYSTT